MIFVLLFSLHSVSIIYFHSRGIEYRSQKRIALIVNIIITTLIICILIFCPRFFSFLLKHRGLIDRHLDIVYAVYCVGRHVSMKVEAGTESVIYLAVLDVVQLVCQVAGPRNVLSRSKQPVVDSQRRCSYEAPGRLLQERNLFTVHRAHAQKTTSRQCRSRI